MQRLTLLDDSKPRLRVNGVAQRLGVHVATIKRLEQKNQFKPTRDIANHRRYSERDVEELRRLLFPPAEVGRAGR